MDKKSISQEAVRSICTVPGTQEELNKGKLCYFSGGNACESSVTSVIMQSTCKSWEGWIGCHVSVGVTFIFFVFLMVLEFECRAFVLSCIPSVILC